MKLLNVQQGTPEWLALRASTFNASEAPAMLGLSKYMTRQELLRQKATGIVPDVDEATQRRFDAGHAAEEATRPLAENILGEALYPVTGTIEVYGMTLLASFDGLTMDESTCFENKLWNEDFAEQVKYGTVPDTHWPQLEHQMIVSGAERVLFTVSDGTRLEHVFYTSVPERRALMLAGWKQFAEDLANYQHVEPVAEVIPAAVEEFPVLVAHARGEITDTNWPQVKDKLDDILANKVIEKPETDQQFADAKTLAGKLRDGAKALKVKKEEVLAQTASIGELAREIDLMAERMNKAALRMEKAVEREESARKERLIADHQEKLRDHVAALNQRLGGNWMPAQDMTVFGAAIKSKRNLESMREALGVALMQSKLNANSFADRIQGNRTSLTGVEQDWSFLFPDFAAVCTKEPQDFDNLLQARIAAHKEVEAKRLEAERERIRQEEADKLQREEAARLQTGIGVAHEAPVPTVTPEQHAEFNKRQGQLEAEAVREMLAPKDNGERMTLGMICALLGFNVTAEFLAGLGFQHVEQRKAVKMFRECDFPAICAAIAQRVTNVAEQFRKAA